MGNPNFCGYLISRFYATGKICKKGGWMRKIGVLQYVLFHGTAIIFDILALFRVPGCQKLQMTA